MKRTLRVFDMKFVLLVTLQAIILLSVWSVLYQLTQLTVPPRGPDSGSAHVHSPPSADVKHDVILQSGPLRHLQPDLPPPRRLDLLPAYPDNVGDARRAADFADPNLGLPRGRAPIRRERPNQRQRVENPPQTTQRFPAVFRNLETWRLCPHICNTTGVFLHVLFRTSIGDMTIYVHDPIRDEGVSNTIMRQGSWQPDMVAALIRRLQNDTTADFLDIGAHVGPFSLAAAKLGRRVFAVEPFAPSAQRLCRSAYENKVQSNIFIVHNALSDSRREVTLRVERRDKTRVSIHENSTSVANARGNPLYAVLLDDLLEVFDMHRVVVKLDASGHEARVLAGGSRFFDQVTVPYVLLTWANVRGSLDAVTVLDWMKERNYVPLHPLAEGMELEPRLRDGWPDRILWKKLQPAAQTGQGFWGKFGF